MHPIAGVVCGLIGLAVGSLMEPVVRRTPIHQRIFGLRLHCRNCGVRAAGVQQVPLAAQLAGKTKCHTCTEPVWSRFPLVSIVMAAVYVVVGMRIGSNADLPAFLVFFTALVGITIVDLRHYLIPNKIVYPALFGCLGLFGLAAIVNGDATRPVTALIGMAAAWLFFFIVWWAYPRGMGFGDVRLSALIGLAAGWVSLGNVALGIFMGLLLGAGVGMLFIVSRVRSRKEAIPFGPFLATGAALSVLWGSNIYHWWIGQ